ncbi:uncharacterized protein LOC100888614 [Strongylocentrotus purpuratus]|uniref:Uncharacterized protein n=1 Tax=Strongylocentrotus purpuratus TaxID=7668 RepID=A0A7M7P108_STRPU|nr:uncharacterized protein LOC100888614 [Strongylocentrotus purpuratus]
MASMTMLETIQALQRRKWEHQQAVPSLGGKYWGEKLTEYGGIGGHPFQGQQRVRDLSVSRSHRHYGSGVTKAATYDQPHRVTDLNKSGCRINDERLSAPLTARLSNFPLQRAEWPGNHPYYSHRSIFEVFPEVKPNPEIESKSDGRASYLTNTTNSYDDALRRLHHNLYHTSLYQQTYKDHFQDTSMSHQQQYTAAPVDSVLGSISLPMKQEDEVKMVREEGDGLIGRYRDEAGKGSTDEEEKDEQEEDEGERDPVGTNENDEENEEEVEEIASQGESSELRSILVSDGSKSANTILPKSSKSQSLRAKRSVSFNETPQVQILDSRDSARGGEDSEQSGNSSTVGASPALQGTGPCWPPSTSLVIENIRGSQLLERRDITNLPAGKCTSKGRIDPLKKMLSSSKIGEHIAFVPRPPLGLKASSVATVPLPSSLKSGSPALASLHPTSDRGSPRLAGDTVHFPSGGEGPLHSGGVTPQLHPMQQNQPFIIPPDYRMLPMKHSGVLGSLPGLRPYSDLVRKRQDEIAKRIMIRKGNLATPLVLPPAPLSECLTPSGTRTPHRLGLRYKTEARKRYNILYPEEIPDLRSTEHSGRKCFFDGDHSSVFRG